MQPSKPQTPPIGPSLVLHLEGGVFKTVESGQGIIVQTQLPHLARKTVVLWEKTHVVDPDEKFIHMLAPTQNTPLQLTNKT